MGRERKFVPYRQSLIAATYSVIARDRLCHSATLAAVFRSIQPPTPLSSLTAAVVMCELEHGNIRRTTFLTPVNQGENDDDQHRQGFIPLPGRPGVNENDKQHLT